MKNNSQFICISHFNFSHLGYRKTNNMKDKLAETIAYMTKELEHASMNLNYYDKLEDPEKYQYYDGLVEGLSFSLELMKTLINSL